MQISAMRSHDVANAVDAILTKCSTEDGMVSGFTVNLGPGSKASNEAGVRMVKNFQASSIASDLGKGGKEVEGQCLNIGKGKEERARMGSWAWLRCAHCSRTTRVSLSRFD